MDELLKLYAQIYQVDFIDRLGEGKDGQVYYTDRLTAVKFLTDADYFNREFRAYRVLADNEVLEVAGLDVPKLIHADDTLLAFEMTVVKPPFIVDFVSAFTDDEIDRLGFTEDVQAEREQFWQERFGDRWPKVAHIRSEFHRLTGLMLLDLSHNNIRFE